MAFTTTETIQLSVTHIKDLTSPVLFTWQGGVNIQAEYVNGVLKLHNVAAAALQTIRIQHVPANIGKGRIMYFLCPVTGKRCKTLYLVKGQKSFKSREALKGTLYYPLQICSKPQRASTRKAAVIGVIGKLTKKRGQETYNGQPTKRSIKISQLQTKLNKAS